jgi:hypothetical protein
MLANFKTELDQIEVNNEQIQQKLNKRFAAKYTKRENTPPDNNERGGYSDTFWRSTRFDPFDHEDDNRNTGLPEFEDPRVFILKLSYDQPSIDKCMTCSHYFHAPASILCSSCQRTTNLTEDLANRLIKSRLDLILLTQTEFLTEPIPRPPCPIEIEYGTWNDDDDIDYATYHLDLLEFVEVENYD